MPSFTVGSMSSLVGHYVAGYECLAPWADVQPNATTRDAVEEAALDDRQFSEKEPFRKAADKDTKHFYDEESEKSESADEDSDDSDSDDSDRSIILNSKSLI